MSSLTSPLDSYIYLFFSTALSEDYLQKQPAILFWMSLNCLFWCKNTRTDVESLLWQFCLSLSQHCFPCGSAGKESTCNAGDLGSIPGLGRSPGEGNGYPLQYSGLENSTDCIVHEAAKNWTWLSDFHFHFTFHVLLWNFLLCSISIFSSRPKFTLTFSWRHIDFMRSLCT